MSWYRVHPPWGNPSQHGGDTALLSRDTRDLKSKVPSSGMWSNPHCALGRFIFHRT